MNFNAPEYIRVHVFIFVSIQFISEVSSWPQNFELCTLQNHAIIHVLVMGVLDFCQRFCWFVGFCARDLTVGTVQAKSHATWTSIAWNSICWELPKLRQGWRNYTRSDSKVCTIHAFFYKNNFIRTMRLRLAKN